jgi:hypothetical protein
MTTSTAMSAIMTSSMRALDVWENESHPLARYCMGELSHLVKKLPKNRLYLSSIGYLVINCARPRLDF